MDDEQKNAVVIDPSVSPSDAISGFGPILPAIHAILLTHAHADHMIALRDWKKTTGAPVLIGEFDLPAMKDPTANVAALLGFDFADFGQADRGLKDGEIIRFGDEVLTVLHTPGHTVGSVCYLSRDAIFSGDTLFAYGGVGRTDFFGGSPPALDASLSRLFSLDPTFTVYPGHGPQTKLAKEKVYHSFRPE